MSVSAAVSPQRSAPFRKWARIFGVFVQDALAYRAVAVIWILTDAIPALVMPLLWLSAFNGRAQIAGFAPSQITAYYLVLLGVTNFVYCHQMWEIAGDIKEGRFSSYLIRPFSYCVWTYLGFVSWRLMRSFMFVPIFLLALVLFRDTLNFADCHLTPVFFLSLILGHFVSFFITYAFGLLALYFVETRSLFNFWYMVTGIFSGQIAPLAMFPEAVRRVADVLPFRYTIALPTEILLGRVNQTSALRGIVIQMIWIVVAYVVGHLLWRNGLKRFTGVGL